MQTLFYLPMSILFFVINVFSVLLNMCICHLFVNKESSMCMHVNDNSVWSVTTAAISQPQSNTVGLTSKSFPVTQLISTDLISSQLNGTGCAVKRFSSPWL